MDPHGHKRRDSRQSRSSRQSTHQDEETTSQKEEETEQQQQQQEEENEDNQTEEQQERPDSTGGKSPSPTPQDTSQQGSRSSTPENQERRDSDQNAGGKFDDVKFEPVDPEDFDTKSFFTNVDALSQRLHSESLRSFDTDYDAHELNEMVSAVTISMENFKNYSMHSQAHLEKLREQIKDVKDRMYKKMSMNPYDSRNEQRVSLEQRELEAKVQHLNRELAKASEELVRAQQTTTETEEAATHAALVAEQAAEEARIIQEEYEARKKAEAESRKRDEERRLAEEQAQKEHEEREEQHRKAEEARRQRLRKDEPAAPHWEQWPTFNYRIDAGDFDQGIGCIVRGDPNHFRENMISCELVNPLDAHLSLEENEELVSNIIDIKGQDDLEHPAYIVIPHCTSRASAMTREPVIKIDTDQGWIELKSHEITFDSHKDLKFVQAEFTKLTRFVVVTRFKRDFLHFSKRGGTIHSTVDQRVAFTAQRGCFQHRENFVVQIQPVDSGTINEVRLKTDHGKELLATSAFMSMEWTAKEFDAPITFSIPVPPNPVRAKKAAAMRAAKEAKMKNPHPMPPPVDDEDQKKKKREQQKKGSRRAAQTGVEEEEEITKKPTKWYMGQYGINEEDENDTLFYTYKDHKGKWHVEENKIINQIRMDLVEFLIDDPSVVDKFLVLRMKTSSEAQEALALTKTIETRLSERTVNFVLKQRSDNPYDIAIEITPHNKLDKALKKFEEEGYDDGPGASKEIVLKEGQHLGIGFRANLQCAEENTNLDLIFNSQLPNMLKLELMEVNKFLQKSYHVYRGFVQLHRKEATICVRSPKKDKQKDKEEVETDDGQMGYTEYSKELLSEHLVSIPKEQEQLEPPTVSKAPIVLRNRDDTINSDTLRQIAGEMGEEWQRVANYLNIKKMRIQAIMRNNQANEGSEEDAKYNMLMTWAKKLPKSMNKVDILCHALTYSGREDLAADLRDMENNFQRQRKGLD